jgi:hypothetical protein
VTGRAPRPPVPYKDRNVTERRLRAGAVVLKTSDAEAKHGAFWTYPDTGRLASANVCHRLERLGLLESHDGLFEGLGGQTYRMISAPPPARRRKAAATQPEASA